MLWENTMLMLVIYQKGKYSPYMAGERFSDSFENELPSRHLDRYAVRISIPYGNRVDALIALEGLLMEELEVDEDAATKLVAGTGFLEQLMDLDKLDPDDKERVEEELFLMAPLLLLWPATRELRDIATAQKWLESATELALSEAEFHDHESCATEPMPPTDECELSSLCPPRTAIRRLLGRALQKPDISGLDALFVDPKKELHMVRHEVNIAARNNLIKKEQLKTVMQHYLMQRQLSPQPEESTE